MLFWWVCIIYSRIGVVGDLLVVGDSGSCVF